MVFNEMNRVLKHDGRIALMIIKARSRLHPKLFIYDARDLVRLFSRYKFKKLKIIEIKPFYIVAKGEKYRPIGI